MFVFFGVCKLLHSCFSLVVSLGVLDFVQRHLVIAPKLGYERDQRVGHSEKLFFGVDIFL